MSTEPIWRIESTSLKDTLAIAEQIGRKLRGGETIELISDLGGGKTAFVKGLAQGMGSRDRVTSPSFTLNNVYQAGDLRLHHFDFYRLDEPGLMSNELAEVINDPQAVVVVEWGQAVQNVLPANRLSVSLVPTSTTGRELRLSYPSELNYLLPTKNT